MLIFPISKHTATSIGSTCSFSGNYKPSLDENPIHSTLQGIGSEMCW